MRLIRTADGREVARIEPGGEAYAVAFSPNGDLLASGSKNGGQLWLTPERVFEKLCRERDGRNLTAQEWKRYIGPAQDWAPTCPEWRSDSGLLAAWQIRNGGRQN